MIRKASIVGLAVFGLARMVAAETEDGLYGAPPPKDAIFVRAIGLPETDIVVFGHAVPSTELPAGTFVAFAPDLLPAGTPGAHYSMVAVPGQAPVLIEEPGRSDPSKVYLSLVNVDASEATLSVAGDGPDVIPNVAAGRADGRGVNPVSVTLEARVDGVSTQVDVSLRRKQNLTFVVRADGSVEMIEDVYGPVYGAGLR